MIKFKKTLLAVVLTTFSLASFSAKYSANPLGSTEESEGDTIAKYLKNLGAYLGYDVTTETTPEEAMLDYTLSIISTGQQVLNAFFAAIPVNSLYSDFTTNTTYDTFNSQANALYQDFTSAGSTSNISVVENVDQQTYQSDPVTQAILNIVGTPDWSVCPASTSSSTPCLSVDQVMTTVLQDVTSNNTLPGETSYFSYSNNSKFISQLNSNNLLAPLVYSNSTDSSSTSSSSGLPSSNQLQQAEDFIRYATEAVMPMEGMSQSDYSTLFSLAYPPTDSDGNVSSDVDATNTMYAKVGLAQYLLGLRVYAAKASVGIANLYSILSKRIPQTSTSGSSSTTTSQALNEFTMATWRQYNPQNQTSDQWAEKINTASPATIQKEMAILLSEISYQLYLNRQQQERILLTESMILLEMLSNNQPSNQIPGNVDTGTATSTTSSS